MQSNMTRIIAAVVDTHNLTLYQESGETITIPQGDTRVRPILDTAVPLLVKQGFADISLDEINPPNDYANFEESSSGMVKLFRVAKSKLFGLFGKKEEGPVEPMTVGSIPQATPVETEVAAKVNAVEDILQHAIPVSSPKFHERGIPQQGNVVEENGDTIKSHGNDAAPDTIIAVVDGKVIPGMEKIKTQISRAASFGFIQGIEKFLSRLGAVIDQRRHSVEDLLKFMERGDLPIADDGSILIYKVLALRNRSNPTGQRTFVDCHTRNVDQWVGAYVCMDPSLVDPNRNNECSNGLHVARRGYVKGFGGDVCVLAKVAPEDVIAVPTYDANKMRVCGYHIIAELSQAQYTLLKQNKPITDDPAGKILLGKAMAGQHIGKTHEVRITGQGGTGVKVKEYGQPDAPEVKPVKVAPVEALANPVEAKEAPVDPKGVVQQVEQLSRKEIAAKLYAEGKVDELKAYKKAAKVSWEKLGVPNPDISPPVALPEDTNGKEITKPAAITPQMVSDAADAIEEYGEDELERFRDEQEAKKTSKKAKTPDNVCISTNVVLGEGSPKERIQKLLAIGLTSVGVAKAILELKKKSKKSWDYLGVSATQVDQITKLAQ
jgi:hypothetical protein